MENEVVKYAPKAVIEELDKIKNIDMIYELFQQGCVLDVTTFGNSNIVDTWVYGIGYELTLKRELAVINHVFGNERLQPEREPRYYVKFIDSEGDLTYVRASNVRSVYLTLNFAPDYEQGIDYETAAKAQALYGGTIKEIK